MRPSFYVCFELGCSTADFKRLTKRCFVDVEFATSYCECERVTWSRPKYKHQSPLRALICKISGGTFGRLVNFMFLVWGYFVDGRSNVMVMWAWIFHDREHTLCHILMMGLIFDVVCLVRVCLSQLDVTEKISVPGSLPVAQPVEHRRYKCVGPNPAEGEGISQSAPSYICRNSPVN